MTSGVAWNCPGRAASVAPFAVIACSPVFHVHATASFPTFDRSMIVSGEYLSPPASPPYTGHSLGFRVPSAETIPGDEAPGLGCPGAWLPGAGAQLAASATVQIASPPVPHAPVRAAHQFPSARWQGAPADSPFPIMYAASPRTPSRSPSPDEAPPPEMSALHS